MIDWRKTCFRLRYLIACLLLYTVGPVPACAIQASPHVIHETQPDGTGIRLHIRGSEYFHWYEDLAGFTVLRDKGRYVYARLGKDRQLVATTWEVGKVDPVARGLKRRTLPPAHIIRQRRAGSYALPAAGGSTLQAAAAVTGTISNLVIMLRFFDHAGRPLPDDDDFDVLFNAVGGDPVLAPSGSVRDVYLENSYGQLVLDSTVVGWIDVPNTEAYYANGDSGDSTLWQALRAALDQVDDVIDFTDFDTDNDGRIDSITFIHSGYGAEWGGTDAYGASYEDRIWSHRWAIQSPPWTSEEGVQVSDYHISPGVWATSGSEIGRIGVIAHETGHFFGLPDLYDTDSGAGEGIGSWGMMANSWGFDSSQLHPPHFSAWSKIELGWVTPTVISALGDYTLPEVEFSPVIYRIEAGYPLNEYLLIENRQPSGIETAIPQGGLAIWHIDDQSDFDTQGYPGQAGWPNNGNHYRVALLQADGNYDLERGHNRGDATDLYHGNGIHRIDADTVPGTDAYQTGKPGDTGNIISSISGAGASMSFTYGPPPPEPTYHLRAEHYEADWIDATAGTLHNLSDNGSAVVPIGFDFEFFGVARAAVTVSANGYLTFGADGGSGTNTGLPSPAAPNDLIAPFWDDLNPEPGGAVYVLAEGVAPLRRTTIAWEGVRHAGGTGDVSFQVTLYESGGDIVFRYLDTVTGDAAYDRGASATIGVEDVAGTDATLYSFDQALISNLDALRFSTRKDVLLVDDDDGDPNVRSSYGAALGGLGVTYDVWDTGAGDPDSAGLADYKGVIWFTGDKYDSTTGPGATGEAALGGYLDSGACLFISSQDYHWARGLTSFMQDYLGVLGVADDVFQTTVQGAGPAFSVLGPYTLFYPPLVNYSDGLFPDTGASVVINADQGATGIARVTSTYSTTFWGFPFEAIADAADRQVAMDAVLRFCADVTIDSDADGNANSHDADDDNDGLPDAVEVMVLGTDPLATDSDGDTLSDFDEVNRDGNPDDYNPAFDTNPLAGDSDGDNWSDAAELAAGTDPLDAGSTPVNSGDINDDGNVDVVDILLGLRILTGMYVPSTTELQRGDVAPVVAGVPMPDAQFTLGDLVVIQRIVFGLYAP